MKTKKITRAKSAKTNEASTKQVKSNVSVEVVKAVEAKAESESPVTNLPVAAKSEKVTSKEVFKAAGSLRATVKEERRGANCTIRLIAERAAAGDAAAVDVLCALCDVPRTALFTLNIDIVRAAVNSYYPYYTEKENRRISVKPVGVWYSKELPQVGKVKVNEPIEAAAKRVQRGYMVVPVADYLDQLIKAAKSRAKGVTPRCVDSNAIYNDIAMSDASEGISVAEIEDAKQRRAYSAAAANVWKKDRNGFYI